MVVDVRELVKKFKDNVAVDCVNLQVQEGEIFGLLGPNGAGKSTTLNAVLGLLRLDGGSIKLFDKELKHNEKEIKQQIGYVPQDFAFFETLSAIDNVTYWGKLYNLRGEQLKSAVKEALEFTGLWERRKGRASTFSGGMKRRLNIACAVVHKPKLLLMDEPTVGVDPQSRNNILGSIKKLNRQGTTVIYTSHYMEEIEEICSRVAIMDFGKVIAEGTVDNLVESMAEERKIALFFQQCPEGVLELLQTTEGVKSVTWKDNQFHLSIHKGEQCLNNLMNTLVKNQIMPNMITTEKANLETVFLKLTGKKLRD